MMKKVMLLSLIVALSAAGSVSADILVGYDFDTGDGTETTAPTVVHSSISATDYGVGNGLKSIHRDNNGPTDGLDAEGNPFGTTNATSFGENRDNFGFVDMNNNNNLGQAINQNDYMTFTVTAATGQLNLTSLTFRTYIHHVNNAAERWALFSSVDGFANGNQITTGQTTDIDTWDGATNNVVVNLSAAKFQGLDEITFRLYIYGGNQNSGSITFFDKVILNGDSGGGAAHSPAPTGPGIDHTVLDPEHPGFISWKAPLTSSDPEGDPNLLSVEQYDITHYIINTDDVTDDDPNWVTAPVEATYVFDDDVTSPYAIPAPVISFGQTMFWRVDTTVVWDSNEMLDPNTYTDNGNGTYTQLVVGSDWQFATEPYHPPAVTFNGVITSVDIGAVLSATVAETSYPINSALTAFDLLEENFAFPTGSDAALTAIDTLTDPLNPTATLTTTYPGTYKVKLTVSDGTSTVETIAQVAVYADDCLAAKAAGTWTQNYYDVTGYYVDPNEPDCVVDVLDFANLAFDWLDDTTMAAQGTYTGLITYVPQDVYNDGIEAEAYFDAGVCSDPPITDTTGIQILNNAGASGGQNLGDTGTADEGGPAWVAYWFNVPVEAVGVPVDVYIGYAKNSGTGNLSFGTSTVSDAYGTTLDLQETGSWTEFVGAYGGQVTFTSSGFQLVRITFDTTVNLDWFGFDWPE